MTIINFIPFILILILSKKFVLKCKLNLKNFLYVLWSKYYSLLLRDSFKLDFILQGVAVENGYNHIENEVESYIPDEDEKYTQHDNVIPSTSGYINGAAKFENSIEENVKHVLDVLPHLGDGFIRKLLARYDNVEQAITAVLESNLPPDLADSDQNEVYIPPDLQDEKFLEAGIQRLNVFDGDEYDVMTQDKLKCVVKRGKGMPGGPKDLKSMLDDKSHVKAFRSRYQQYNMVTEDSNDDEYDDEYDDSYDALAESETKTVRLAKNVIVDEIDDDESEESDDDNFNEGNEFRKKSNQDFCENPEIVRARYEHKRNMMLRRNDIGNKNSKIQADVIGKPKYQGQDDKTQNARRQKDVNKSSRANHNRKRGAQFKQSRGMIPMWIRCFLLNYAFTTISLP